jgi:hypothetical protein
MSAQAIRWLTAAGASCIKSSVLNATDECEISPLLSYSGEGLSHLNGAKIPLPSFFRSKIELDNDDD